ncbi:hypothetical protein [Hoylesella buccalis]|nr:hypothetical protein [Hoylesella buccalis]
MTELTKYQATFLTKMLRILATPQPHQLKYGKHLTIFLSSYQSIRYSKKP